MAQLHGLQMAAGPASQSAHVFADGLPLFVNVLPGGLHSLKVAVVFIGFIGLSLHAEAPYRVAHGPDWVSTWLEWGGEHMAQMGE